MAMKKHGPVRKLILGKETTARVNGQALHCAGDGT
jgi:hypothetical protein